MFPGFLDLLSEIGLNDTGQGQGHDTGACRGTQLRNVLARVGDKWSLCVVGALYGGPVRFNVLKRRVAGVSQRMLTLTLRGLERDGLVSRTVYPSNPPSVEYALTEMGRTLLEPVLALVRWSQQHLDEIAQARERFDAAQAGE
jgi:DNA-binding HxlR family transcriptional regulator